MYYSLTECFLRVPCSALGARKTLPFPQCGHGARPPLPFVHSLGVLGFLHSLVSYNTAWASQVVLVAKNPPADARDNRFNPWVGKMPLSRKWQPTPLFFPGESHGQRSLVDYSPWGHKESDVL